MGEKKYTPPVLLNSTLQEAYNNNDKELFQTILWALMSDRHITQHEYNTLKEIVTKWEEFPRTAKIFMGNLGYKQVLNANVTRFVY